MATAVAFSLENCENLCELYLALWRLLGCVSEEGKWLETRPESLQEIQERVRAAMDQIAPDPASVVYTDYRTAQQFLLGNPGPGATEFSGFRDYLRDTGIRYAQLADSMLPDAGIG